MNPINVTSDIEPLKEVLLHRPGKELLNLTPNNLERLLFDDIPFLKEAQKQHDAFAQKLKENGVNVVYLEDLMAEVLEQSPQVKQKFIKQFISEANVQDEYKEITFNYLNSIKNTKDLVLKTMEGLRASELDNTKTSFFITDPMPNLYFTRDNFSSIGTGISLNKMYSQTRSRETIYGEYIFNYHPKYKGKVDKYYDRYEKYHIEGGDISNLNANILLIGISQRTEMKAITKLAKNLFQNKDSNIDTILVLNIPKNRAFMHLDTVFTQVDYDKFVYYPGILDDLKIYEITKLDNQNLDIKEINETLENTLEKHLKTKVTLIPCANGNQIDAAREQWNDGCNTLCISPGLVIVYNRNPQTNELLKKHGIKLIEINSSELSRGRGGPRCMSMPLIRKSK